MYELVSWSIKIVDDLSFECESDDEGNFETNGSDPDKVESECALEDTL